MNLSHRIERVFCIAAAALLAAVWVDAEGPPMPAPAISAREIVDRSQTLMRGLKSSRAVVAMTLTRPGYQREFEVESFHWGRDKTFLIIHKPEREKGDRTLRIKQDVWTYTRDTEQAIKIPYSMMQTSWMGSDFSYEDMAKLDSYVTDYNHKLSNSKPDSEGRSDLLVTIEMVPKESAPVVWGKVIWEGLMTKDGGEVIPVNEMDYSERGELVREITFSKVKTLGGRRIPTVMICTPHKKKGQKTVLTYKSAEFDSDLDPKIFTKETLEKGLK